MTLTTALGDFGAPPDAVAWAALLLGLVTLAAGLHPALARLTARTQDRLSVALLAIFAAALSWIYVVVYLRGNPRIVDATTYYLQARALSEGHLTFDVPAPSASFRGRFLLPSRMAIRSPGSSRPVPATRARFLVEPAARRSSSRLLSSSRRTCSPSAFRRRTWPLAAALSAVCGVLQYHTADTMSHGWSALLFAVAIWSALIRTPVSAFGAEGLRQLAVARPLTGALALLPLLPPPQRRRAGWHSPCPPPSRYFSSNSTPSPAHGSIRRKPPTMHWRMARPAAGIRLRCGVSCVFEHGDSVQAHLAHGYGFYAAAGTTLRR